jgi:hypothetical protein
MQLNPNQNMNNLKMILVAVLFYSFSDIAFGQDKNEGTYIDQEKIPYGFLQLNMGLTYSHFKDYQYESYTMDGPDPYNANLISPIPYTTLNKITTFGMGGGLEGHFPLIYLIFHNKERRFRVADDIGLGTYLITNKITRKNVLTNQKLILTERGNSKIDGSIIFYAGIHAVFRINKTFDIGATYYPVFLHYDFYNPGAFGQTFGFTARIQRLYVDCRITKRKDNNMIVNKGLRTATLRYSIRPFDSDKNPSFLFLTYTSFVFQNNIFPEGTTRPAGYENYKLKNSNWTLIECGWGMGF